MRFLGLLTVGVGIGVGAGLVLARTPITVHVRPVFRAEPRAPKARELLDALPFARAQAARGRA